MLQHRATGIREGMSPFRTQSLIHIPQQVWCPPSPRHIPLQAWSPPSQQWHVRNGPPSQRNRSPHYNPCPSPSGYQHSPHQWSPNRWEPASNYRRNWGSSPRTPSFSSYKHSPEHKSMYGNKKDKNAQVNFKRNLKDISNYYSPSMLEDPWAELQGKIPGASVPTANI